MTPITTVKKKDRLYYARIIPKTGIYEVCEIILRTIEDTWFVGIDKRDKHAYMFNYSDLNTILFAERKDALDNVKAAEKNKIKISEETDYEEY